jgi:hypothetical protein
MGNRWIIGLTVVIALLLWGGILALANEQPPTSANQAIFLILWGLAVSSAVFPISYAANGRYARSRGPREDFGRALRQGLLIGILAIILMTLRLLGVLTVSTALVLILVVVLVEVMLALRDYR